MLRGVTLLALLASLGTMSPAHAGEARQDYRSPDGKLIAKVVEVNKAHESRLEIRDSVGKVLLANDYSSPDMEHGQAICRAEWTPDGEFFVFSMENTGGHSPLGRPTSFYSRQQNRIYDLDKSVGYITGCNFKLQTPNWIITKRMGRPVRVALGTLVK